MPQRFVRAWGSASSAAQSLRPFCPCTRDQRIRVTRVLRHAGLAAVSFAAIVLSALYWPQRSVAYAVSFVTAYASLLCLAITLGLGPWYAMRGRRLPTSSYLRRDVGIWTALLAVVHVGFGLFVHMHGNVWLYFLRASPDQEQQQCGSEPQIIGESERIDAWPGEPERTRAIRKRRVLQNVGTVNRLEARRGERQRRGGRRARRRLATISC